MSEDKFEQWALVELFGHQKIAGLLSEQTIGGCQFVRVDVPPVAGRNGFTKLFGNGAIYAISFVDEAIAKAAAASFMVRPIHTYDLRALKTDAVADRLENANPGF